MQKAYHELGPVKSWSERIEKMPHHHTGVTLEPTLHGFLLREAPLVERESEADPIQRSIGHDWLRITFESSTHDRDVLERFISSVNTAWNTMHVTPIGNREVQILADLRLIDTAAGEPTPLVSPAKALELADDPRLRHRGTLVVPKSGLTSIPQSDRAQALSRTGLETVSDWAVEYAFLPKSEENFQPTFPVRTRRAHEGPEVYLRRVPGQRDMFWISRFWVMEQTPLNGVWFRPWFGGELPRVVTVPVDREGNPRRRGDITFGIPDSDDGRVRVETPAEIIGIGMEIIRAHLGHNTRLSGSDADVDIVIHNPVTAPPPPPRIDPALRRARRPDPRAITWASLAMQPPETAPIGPPQVSKPTSDERVGPDRDVEVVSREQLRSLVEVLRNDAGGWVFWVRSEAEAADQAEWAVVLRGAVRPGRMAGHGHGDDRSLVVDGRRVDPVDLAVVLGEKRIAAGAPKLPVDFQWCVVSGQWVQEFATRWGLTAAGSTVPAWVSAGLRGRGAGSGDGVTVFAEAVLDRSGVMRPKLTQLQPMLEYAPGGNGTPVGQSELVILPETIASASELTPALDDPDRLWSQRLNGSARPGTASSVSSVPSVPSVMRVNRDVVERFRAASLAVDDLFARLSGLYQSVDADAYHRISTRVDALIGERDRVRDRLSAGEPVTAGDMDDFRRRIDRVDQAVAQGASAAERVPSGPGAASLTTGSAVAPSDVLAPSVQDTRAAGLHGGLDVGRPTQAVGLGLTRLYSLLDQHVGAGWWAELYTQVNALNAKWRAIQDRFVPGREVPSAEAAVVFAGVRHLTSRVEQEFDAWVAVHFDVGWQIPTDDPFFLFAFLLRQTTTDRLRELVAGHLEAEQFAFDRLVAYPVGLSAAERRNRRVAWAAQIRQGEWRADVDTAVESAVWEILATLSGMSLRVYDSVEPGYVDVGPSGPPRRPLLRRHGVYEVAVYRGDPPATQGDGLTFESPADATTIVRGRRRQQPSAERVTGRSEHSTEIIRDVDGNGEALVAGWLIMVGPTSAHRRDERMWIDETYLYSRSKNVWWRRAHGLTEAEVAGLNAVRVAVIPPGATTINRRVRKGWVHMGKRIAIHPRVGSHRDYPLHFHGHYVYFTMDGELWRREHPLRPGQLGLGEHPSAMMVRPTSASWVAGSAGEWVFGPGGLLLGDPQVVLSMVDGLPYRSGGEMAGGFDGVEAVERWVASLVDFFSSVIDSVDPTASGPLIAEPGQRSLPRPTVAWEALADGREARLDASSWRVVVDRSIAVPDGGVAAVDRRRLLGAVLREMVRIELLLASLLVAASKVRDGTDPDALTRLTAACGGVHDDILAWVRDRADVTPGPVFYAAGEIVLAEMTGGELERFNSQFAAAYRAGERTEEYLRLLGEVRMPLSEGAVGVTEAVWWQAIETGQPSAAIPATLLDRIDEVNELFGTTYPVNDPNAMRAILGDIEADLRRAGVAVTLSPDEVWRNAQSGGTVLSAPTQAQPRILGVSPPVITAHPEADLVMATLTGDALERMFGPAAVAVSGQYGLVGVLAAATEPAVLRRLLARATGNGHDSDSDGQPTAQVEVPLPGRVMWSDVAHLDVHYGAGPDALLTQQQAEGLVTHLVDHRNRLGLTSQVALGAERGRPGEAARREAGRARKLYGVELIQGRLRPEDRNLVSWLDCLATSRAVPLFATREQLLQLARDIGIVEPSQAAALRKLWGLARLSRDHITTVGQDGRDALTAALASPTPWQSTLDNADLVASSAPDGFDVTGLAGALVVRPKGVPIPDLAYRALPSEALKVFVYAGSGAQRPSLGSIVGHVLSHLFGQAPLDLQLYAWAGNAEATTYKEMLFYPPDEMQTLVKQVTEHLVVGSATDGIRIWRVDDRGEIMVPEDQLPVSSFAKTRSADPVLRPDPAWDRMRSSVVGVVGADDRVSGLTAQMLEPWFKHSGVDMPPTLRSDLQDVLWSETTSGRPANGQYEATFGPTDAAAFLAWVTPRLHEAQQQTLGRTVRQAVDWIERRFPADRFAYVGIGRSPTAVLVLLQGRGHVAVNIPLSEFRPAPADPTSILAAVLDEPPPEPGQLAMLRRHFDEFLGDLPPSRGIVLVDYVHSGATLIAAQHHFREYLKLNGRGGTEVHAIALTTPTGLPEVDEVRRAIVEGRQEAPDDAGQQAERAEWDRHFHLLVVGGDGGVTDPGDLLEDALDGHVFNDFSEYGSYSVLQQAPETFERDRPRPHAATGIVARLRRLNDRFGARYPVDNPVEVEAILTDTANLLDREGVAVQLSMAAVRAAAPWGGLDPAPPPYDDREAPPAYQVLGEALDGPPEKQSGVPVPLIGAVGRPVESKAPVRELVSFYLDGLKLPALLGPAGLGAGGRAGLLAVLARAPDPVVRDRLARATGSRYDEAYRADDHVPDLHVPLRKAPSPADVKGIVVHWGTSNNGSERSTATRREAQELVEHLTRVTGDMGTAIAVELGQEIGIPGKAALQAGLASAASAATRRSDGRPQASLPLAEAAGVGFVEVPLPDGSDPRVRLFRRSNVWHVWVGLAPDPQIMDLMAVAAGGVVVHGHGVDGGIEAAAGLAVALRAAKEAGASKAQLLACEQTIVQSFLDQHHIPGLQMFGTAKDVFVSKVGAVFFGTGVLTPDGRLTAAVRAEPESRVYVRSGDQVDSALAQEAPVIGLSAHQAMAHAFEWIRRRLTAPSKPAAQPLPNADTNAGLLASGPSRKRSFSVADLVVRGYPPIAWEPGARFAKRRHAADSQTLAPDTLGNAATLSADGPVWHPRIRWTPKDSVGAEVEAGRGRAGWGLRRGAGPVERAGAPAPDAPAPDGAGGDGDGDVAASVPGLVAELVGLGWSVVGGVWGEGVLGEVFPWLGLVNPWRGVGGDFVTNCVVAAIGLDLALRDVADGVPLDRVGYQVPPEGPSLVGWLANYAGRGLVEVAGWGSVAEFMGVAPVGSRGFVVFEDGVGGRQHVVNVVRDGRLGVVFLDGQHGRQAWTPPVVGRMRFVATTAGVTPVTVAPPVVVAGGEDVAGGDSSGGAVVPGRGGKRVGVGVGGSDGSGKRRRLVGPAEGASVEGSPLEVVVGLVSGGPVSGWLSDRRLSDAREPGLRGPGDELNVVDEPGRRSREYSPSPAQLVRLAVLGLVPVQVERGGDCFLEVLVRSAPERVGRWLGVEGVLLGRDMRGVLAEVRARLVAAFREDVRVNPGLYGVLGAPGSAELVAGVERVVAKLGTAGGWTEFEDPLAVVPAGGWDVGDALPQWAARLMGLSVELIRLDGGLEVLSDVGDGLPPVRLVRVEHPGNHYLATVSAGVSLVAYSVGRLAELWAVLRSDPLWELAGRLMVDSAESLDGSPLGEVLAGLDGSDELRRERTRLRVLVDELVQARQAVEDAAYLGDESSGYELGVVAVVALWAMRALTAVRAMVDRYVSGRGSDGGVVVDVVAGVVVVEGVQVRLTGREVDGAVRLVRRAVPVEGGSGWDVFAHRGADGGGVISSRRLGVLTVRSGDRTRLDGVG